MFNGAHEKKDAVILQQASVSRLVHKYERWSGRNGFEPSSPRWSPGAFAIFMLLPRKIIADPTAKQGEELKDV